MKKTEKSLLLSKHDHWIRPFFHYHRWLLALIFFLGCLTFFCGSALMFTSGYLISKAATKPANILLIYVPIVLTRAFGIGRPVFRYLERLTSHNWVLRMTSKLRLQLYQVLEQMTPTAAQADVPTYQSGEILGLLAEDIEHIQNFFLRTLFPLILSGLLSICLTLFLGLFSWAFAGLTLVLLLLLIIWLPLLSVGLNRGHVFQRKAAQHELYTKLTDTILGLGDWQYSGRKQAFLSLAQPAVEKSAASNHLLQRFSRRRDLLAQGIVAGIIIALFYWSATYFSGSGAAGLNWVAAFVLAFFPLIDAFVPVSQAVMEWPNYADTAERLNALPYTPVQTNELSQVDSQLVKRKTEIPKQAGLTFKNVSYKYGRQQSLLLDQFSLQIAPGEKVALLGKSGAGKTTLLRLLTAELPMQKGEIWLNDQAIAALADEIPNWIGILDQAPYLFATTLRNNLTLGNLKASEQQILAAVEQAGLGPLVASLPAGLDTFVEENGQRFSGGEQQRIALARLLLQDVPIILLDEPTVGLDPLTEIQLLNTIFTALNGKTILWVTHHLAGIEAADRVLFLEAGHIIMSGTSQELFQKNERYRQLYLLDRAHD